MFGAIEWPRVPCNSRKRHPGYVGATIPRRSYDNLLRPRARLTCVSAAAPTVPGDNEEVDAVNENEAMLSPPPTLGLLPLIGRTPLVELTKFDTGPCDCS